MSLLQRKVGVFFPLASIELISFPTTHAYLGCCQAHFFPPSPQISVIIPELYWANEDSVLSIAKR